MLQEWVCALVKLDFDDLLEISYEDHVNYHVLSFKRFAIYPAKVVIKSIVLNLTGSKINKLSAGWVVESKKCLYALTCYTIGFCDLAVENLVKHFICIMSRPPCDTIFYVPNPIRDI
jgi:hypothetical protein